MKEFPPFRLDVADQCVWRGDQRLHLTPKAFAVLRYLVERAGRLVTQTELLEALWPDTFVQPEVLKSQILDIRTALGDRPKDPLFIETVPRRGYRFIAAVRDSGQPEAAPGGRAPASLVGRDKAIEELRAALQRASNGERQIVFVTGEQGIGKTTMVDAFLEEATGFQVARGQCLEGFGAVKEPYYPVLDALGHLSRGKGREGLAAALETYAPTWLIQLPALLTREHRDTLQRELLGATRERMLREICEALEKLTEEHTLVLLLEDLHWTDHATVDLIATLAYRRSPARLLLLGTYRPVDVVLAQHPLKQVSHSLKGRKLAREIALSPLGESEVAEYLARQAGSGDSAAEAPVQRLARWIRKQTEGNPLFMVTVVEHLLQLGHIALSDAAWTVATPLEQIEVAVPDTLRQMIELQIEQLSPREQLALEAASVHGMVFSAAVTAAALEIDVEGVEDTCEKLAQQHHMIRAAELEQLADGSLSPRYEFVHAAFRNVFYHRLTPARRAKLHRRFGETIEARHPGDRIAIAAELAGHFSQCADWPRTVEYLWLAAKNAWQRLATREAIAILKQALRAAANLPADGRLRAEVRILNTLTVLQHALHDLAQVVPTLKTLADRAAACGAEDIEARAVTGLASLLANDDCRASLPWIERLQALITRQTDPAEQAQGRAHLAAMQLLRFGWDETLAGECAAGAERARASNDRLAAASYLMDYSYIQSVSSRYAESLATTRACLPAMLESGRLVRYLHGRDLLAVNHTFLGQWGQALDILDAELEDADKNEAPRRLTIILVFKAWLHLKAMDFAGASEMCRRALPLLDEPFMRDRKCLALQFASSAELGLGRVDAALVGFVDLCDSLDRQPAMFSWFWRMPLQIELAEAWLANGDLTKSRVAADRAVELATRAADRTFQGLAWELSARVAFREGDAPRSQADIQRGLEAIRGYDVPLAAWRVHATAAAVLGRADHRELSRNIALALAESLDTRPQLREIFLAAPLIAELLGGGAHLQAGSAAT